jgi:hypothetical protein
VDFVLETRAHADMIRPRLPGGTAMEDRTQRVVTAERLREVLDYDPETGVFTWLVRTGVRIKVGDRAGTLSGGYRIINVDGIAYRAARLAWLHVTGNWPRNEIDHDNRRRDDDRWENLKDKTSAEQKHNRGRHTANTSGFAGVGFYKPKNKWRARVMVNGKTRTAYCDTKEEAVAARDKIRAELGLSNAIDEQGPIATILRGKLACGGSEVSFPDGGHVPQWVMDKIVWHWWQCDACRLPLWQDRHQHEDFVFDVDPRSRLAHIVCRHCKKLIDFARSNSHVMTSLQGVGMYFDSKDWSTRPALGWKDPEPPTPPSRSKRDADVIPLRKESA